MEINKDSNPIPILGGSKFFPDLTSLVQFLTNPRKLFAKAQLNPNEIFGFRMPHQPWFFLTGDDGVFFYSRLTFDEVDPFEFRVKMFKASIPGAKMPANMAEISRATNTFIKNHLDTIDIKVLRKLVSDLSVKHLSETLQDKSGTINNFNEFLFVAYTKIIGTVLLGEEVFDLFPKDFGQVYYDATADLRRLTPLIINFTSRFTKTNKAKTKISQYFLNVINERKKYLVNNPPTSILDHYITIQKTLNFTDENLIWLINLLLQAAFHYSSTQSTLFFIDLLSQDQLLPSIIAQQAQFDVVNGDSIHEIPLLYGLIRECFRVHCLYAIPRRVTKDLSFKEYIIPQGSVIAISPYMEHFNSNVYQNPTLFDPGRWSAGNDKVLATSFIPAGLGFFGCLGVNFLLQFYEVFWLVLLQNYNLELMTSLPNIKPSVLPLPPTKPLKVKYSRTARCDFLS